MDSVSSFNVELSGREVADILIALRSQYVRLDLQLDEEDFPPAVYEVKLARVKRFSALCDKFAEL